MYRKYLISAAAMAAMFLASAAFAQNAWHAVFHTLGTRHFSGKRLLLAKANTLFDPSGNLTEEPTREKLKQFLAAFVAFAGA